MAARCRLPGGRQRSVRAGFPPTLSSTLGRQGPAGACGSVFAACGRGHKLSDWVGQHKELASDESLSKAAFEELAAILEQNTELDSDGQGTQPQKRRREKQNAVNGQQGRVTQQEEPVIRMFNRVRTLLHHGAQRWADRRSVNPTGEQPRTGGEYVAHLQLRQGSRARYKGICRNTVNIRRYALYDAINNLDEVRWPQKGARQGQAA